MRRVHIHVCESGSGGLCANDQTEFRARAVRGQMFKLGKRLNDRMLY